MLKKTIAVLTTAAIFSVVSMTAQAVAFNFQSDRTAVYDFDMLVDGISLNVRASSFNDNGGVWNGGAPNPANPQRVVTTTANGLGIMSINSSNHQDDTEFEGIGRNDVAIFDFSRKVVIDSVTFVNFDSGDHFSFFAGVDPIRSKGFDFAQNADLSGWQSKMFGIGARYDEDDFYIESITVTAVTLPPSILLFGAALIGGEWLSRRRKQASAV